MTKEIKWNDIRDITYGDVMFEDGEVRIEHLVELRDGTQMVVVEYHITPKDYLMGEINEIHKHNEEEAVCEAIEKLVDLQQELFSEDNSLSAQMTHKALTTAIKNLQGEL